jgi:hypothetical protein
MQLPKLVFSEDLVLFNLVEEKVFDVSFLVQDLDLEKVLLVQTLLMHLLRCHVFVHKDVFHLFARCLTSLTDKEEVKVGSLMFFLFLIGTSFVGRNPYRPTDV